ncbi:pre-mRNA-splicing factor ATP-dependent RNA helicase DHX16 [Strigomonas culicis]|nr:pre-mRNA-splicing factor ATP-dependent RNA helicase DHX16 [Strigomonas culicis]|eukprot:EPY21279.1 pre-mRNA-splicing factor ATP-dependent RNA helicase DHX16 [Strigomonas culicis]
MNCRCGSTVGYKVRFDDKTSATSRVVFVTDGMMLKEFTSDPNMDTVGAIMIDEAHERSLSTDVLLGLLRDVIRRNKHIKVIVASATINADKFSSFFSGAPIFSIKGRTYPVETFYAEGPVSDYVAESAQTALGLHLSKPLPGDILIFLPGQDAIEECAQQLRDYAAEMKDTIQPLVILPIYAALPPKEQARIYEKTPPSSRKVVIATNIAETSITIDGVVYVIDCGLCKQNYYNPKAMAEELRVVPTSQASATQRAGRAGRTQAGECYRLFTAYTFKNELPPETVPEIKRCSMSAVVLQLKALGINNLLQFDFIDAPSTDSLERALDHLFLLGGMRADGTLTVTGRRMAEFPLDPSFSKALIRACALGCGRHMAMAAAMLSLESVFISSRDAKVKQQIESARRQLFSFGNGDVTGYINLMEEWLRAGPRAADFCKTHCIHPRSLMRARDVMDQILKTFDRIGLDVADADPGAKADSNLINAESITRALLSGFFFNVAKMELDKRTYRIVRPMDTGSASKGGDDEPPTAELHPTSFLFRAGMTKGDARGGQGEDTLPPILKERPHLVLFVQLRHTTKRFMIHTTAIPQIEWVLESAPRNYFQREALECGLRKRVRP